MSINPARPAAPATGDAVGPFLSSSAPEAFSGIVHLNQVAVPDPFDVPQIHAEAREVLGRLVARASSPEPPPHGTCLLLLGEGGSGKTHLMRAFRHAVHGDRVGYCGYMQMGTASGDYRRYVLRKLIDSLELPYAGGRGESGLLRLARGVLDAVDVITPQEKAELADLTVDHADAARLVHRLADLAAQDDRFRDADLDLLRALLFLIPEDGRIRKRVLKWLRSEELGRSDRELLDLAARPDPEDAVRTLVGLGKLAYAVHTAALVLLIDQIEDTLEGDADDPAKGKTLRDVVNAAVELGTNLPNAVVVLACLEDLFHLGKGQLQRTKLDRIERDPPPVRLSSKRTPEELAAMLERRLDAIYDGAERPHPLFPYREADLRGLEPLSTRNALHMLGRHRDDCARAGRWAPPDWSAVQPDVQPPPPSLDLARAWNDFLAADPEAPPDDEAGLAELLAFALTRASDELPNGARFSARPEGRFVPVECRNPAGQVSPLYVAVCERNPQHNALSKQIDEAVGGAGAAPVVLVRSKAYPTTPTAKVAQQIKSITVPLGTGRKVVVPPGDWRVMAAFRAFHRQKGDAPDFARWQLDEAPLGRLESVRQILKLDAARAMPPAPKAPPPRQPTIDFVPPPESTAPPPPPPAPPRADGVIVLGTTRAAEPADVTVAPAFLCRHAAFLGGSGSGKSTAALTLIEGLLLGGVPAILVDRKGDLARYADPAAWDEPEADPALAERRRQLRAAVDVRLYTPGEARGRPLSIPIAPPDFADLSSEDREVAAANAASGLAAMMGYRGASHTHKVAILQKAVEILARRPGAAVTPRALAALARSRDDALLAETDGFDDKHFANLSQDLLAFSIQQGRLLEGGETLSVDGLFGRAPDPTPPGKARLSILNTQALVAAGDAASDFWVSQFLLAVSRWLAKNPARSGALQAVVLLDEADKYLPAGNSKPATKAPAENLLKRARSGGLGVFLASQSPGDFDYKCRDQISTWLVGQIKEAVAVNKVRPLLEAGRRDAASRLPGLATGDFFLARGADVLPIRGRRNALPTEQVPLARVLELAQAGRGA